MTYGQIRDALQAALTASLSEDDAESNWIYIADFDDAIVTYEVGYGEYVQDGYTLDDSGDVTLKGDPQPVKPVTTYVPMEQEAALRASLEERGLRTGSMPTVRSATLSPVKVKSEPLTYFRQGRHSFYRDMILTDRVEGADERLNRHRSEMDVLHAERERKAWAALHAADFDYELRVEPNRTDGQGGYFSPPLWLTELAATARRPGRVLTDLIPGHFTLPMGVSSVNIPIISNGTTDAQTEDISAVPDTDITDQAGSSLSVTFSGDADIALQDLELSPVGASIDMAIFLDLSESYGSNLEAAVLYGAGTAFQQLPGIAPNATTNVSYSDNSPTGSEMWPLLAEAAAQLADARDLPPEIWLMRSARWFWLQGQESTTGYPFGLSPMFLGKDDPLTPNPIGGLMGLPVFLDDSVSATLGPVSAPQDEIIAVRPSDLFLFETAPMTAVMQEPGSANLSVRIQMHGYAAAITRYTQGVATVTGTGMSIASGY